MFQTWILRNQIVFAGKRPFIKEWLSHTSILVESDVLNRGNLPPSPMAKSGGWRPPPQGWVKANFDVAVRDNLVVFAALFCDDSKIIYAATEKANAMPPLQAEACAALFTIRMARDLYLNNVIFEGDSLLVCDALADQSVIPDWDIESLILEGRELLVSHFSFHFCQHIPRLDNSAVHNLAHWAASCNFFGFVLIDELPDAVLKDTHHFEQSVCTPCSWFE